jgi:hypothetical protein
LSVSNIGKLIVDVRTAEGSPQQVEIPVARTLAPDVMDALIRDLAARGELLVSPYEQVRGQLRRLAALAEAETDPRERLQLLADRRSMLEDLTRHFPAKKAELEGEAVERARATPEGLTREITERAKAAGMALVPKEVFAVLIPGNCHKVYADLLAALKPSTADPTVATSPQPGTSG